MPTIQSLDCQGHLTVYAGVLNVLWYKDKGGLRPSGKCSDGAC
jgi:hypothetical protein